LWGSFRFAGNLIGILDFASLTLDLMLGNLLETNGKSIQTSAH
jgi:hypothetical protein